MFALLIAVKLAPANCNLRIWTDNISNIFGVASGGGRYQEDCSTFNDMVNTLLRYLTEKDIAISLKYINTKENPADYPSRNRQLTERLYLNRASLKQRIPGLFKRCSVNRDEIIDFY